MTHSTEIVVKILGKAGYLDEAGSFGMRRQLPGRIPAWGPCRFVYDDTEEYDWLVVYDDLKGEFPCHCSAGNTLLVTLEPSSIKTYGSSFLKQFGYILTGQEDWALKHPGKIWSQPALFWFYGDHPTKGKDYDAIASSLPIDKSGVISTVCSTKQHGHTLHRQRYYFTQELKKRLPCLEHYGRGVRSMEDKSEALDSYKYHIAIENHRSPHWWTEKISDAFLGLTLPFYYGATNLTDYFPADSFVPIDIFDVEGSFRKIQAAIDHDEYSSRLPAIREARELVLNKYNFYATVADIIQTRHRPNNSAPRVVSRIRGRHEFRRSFSGKLSALTEKVLWKINCARHVQVGHANPN